MSLGIDGYDAMVQTESWKKLQAAQDAVFEAELAMSQEGFQQGADFAWLARNYLRDAENVLRCFFKGQAILGECRCTELPTPDSYGRCSVCCGSLVGRVTTRTILLRG